MGYKIIYDHQSKDGFRRKKYNPKVRRWIAAALLMTVVLCMLIQPVRFKFKEILLPGNWSATEVALDSMVQRIRHGGTFYEAVAVFCQEIIDDSKAN